MAEFIIQTKPKQKFVDIVADSNADFIDWMMACEFMLHKTAQLSPAGYEKALELLCNGAMTYKVISEEK